MRSLLLVRVSVVIAGCLAFSQPATAQPSQLVAKYTVTVTDPATQVFHVRAEFRNLSQPVLELSLPIWTPGWYTLEYYAKNIRGFVVRDDAGARLRSPLSKVQTWTIDTRGREAIVAEFDYVATSLAVNRAKLTTAFGFFTGTQLFLEPIGHRNSRPRVTFVLPDGWRIVSALDESTEPTVFEASDYDELVDAPTWVGAVENYRFTAAGVPHFIAFDPARQIKREQLDAFAGKLRRIIETEAELFGGLPYRKYVIFLTPPGDATSGDALEHGNSYVNVAGANPSTLGDGLLQGAAHEIFHAWNAKRIRPAELWPYDYSRPIETPSLWFAEGVTDYLAQQFLLRSGVWSEEVFLERMPRGPLTNPEAAFMSPTDASMSTFRDYLNEPVSYYGSGEILGLVLDLSILRDTQGKQRLDDVFRRLWKNFYLNGKGFTAADLEKTVTSVAGRDYREFFERYVRGTTPPPLPEVFGYAGYSILTEKTMRGQPIASGEFVDDGFRITGAPPGGAMQGLEKGDVIIRTDGNAGVPWTPGTQGLWVRSRAGLKMMMTVRRGQTEVTLPLIVPNGETITRSLTPDPMPTESQLAVRRAWLLKQR